MRSNITMMACNCELTRVRLGGRAVILGVSERINTSSHDDDA
jgi:hypothetical protein